MSQQYDHKAYIPPEQEPICVWAPRWFKLTTRAFRVANTNMLVSKQPHRPNEPQQKLMEYGCFGNPVGVCIGHVDFMFVMFFLMLVSGGISALCNEPIKYWLMLHI